MFAALTLDREPMVLSWDTFLGSLISWTQLVGGFAMVGLVLWLIAYRLSRGNPEAAGAQTLARGLLLVLFGPFGALLVILLALRHGGSALRSEAPAAGGGSFTVVLFIGAM